MMKIGQELAREIEGRVPHDREIFLWWLGQSGFVIRNSKACIVVDPYLSTTLEDATRDQPWKRHIRMMPICVDPSQLKVDAIFCTHAHRDHYDPPTVRAIQKSNPNIPIVAPYACVEMAERDGLKNAVPIDAGITLRFTDFAVTAVPSKHNEFDHRADSGYPYLGFVFDFDGIRVYHAGDTLLYDGLAAKLGELRVQLALLPINGRTPDLIAKGFASNMNYHEAPELCKRAGIHNMIPCHYDMFTINTEQVGRFVNYANNCAPDIRYWVPVIGEPCAFSLKGFLPNDKEYGEQ